MAEFQTTFGQIKYLTVLFVPSGLFKFDFAIGILARLPLSKILAMDRPFNAPVMPPERTEKVWLGISFSLDGHRDFNPTTKIIII